MNRRFLARIKSQKMARTTMVPQHHPKATPRTKRPTKPLPERIVTNPAREVGTSEPKSPPDSYVRQVPRAHQLIEGASGDVEELRCFIGVEERLGQRADALLVFNPLRHRPIPIRADRSVARC